MVKNIMWIHQLEQSLKTKDAQIADYEARLRGLRADRVGTVQQLEEAKHEV